MYTNVKQYYKVEQLKKNNKLLKVDMMAVDSRLLFCLTKKLPIDRVYSNLELEDLDAACNDRTSAITLTVIFFLVVVATTWTFFYKMKAFGYLCSRRK